MDRRQPTSTFFRRGNGVSLSSMAMKRIDGLLNSVSGTGSSGVQGGKPGGIKTRTIFGSRYGSSHASAVQEEEDKEKEIPAATIDIALVGVEHSGKSTFFKQITSLYTPEDFKRLVNSDGRSQAVGTLLKITITILKSVRSLVVAYNLSFFSQSLLHK